jgi:23S rRNA (adenine2503-C2)-methyltransferase
LERPDIKSLTLPELQDRLEGFSQPAFRARQVAHWLYRHRVTRWVDMTNLPQALREQLDRHFTLHTLSLVTRQGARDDTQKFLWRLPDGSLIESVLIPASPALYGDPSDRHTLCLSTQVGCAYGCRFCASGLAGWKRHLEPFEMVEQVLATERWQASQPPLPAPSAPSPTPEQPVVSNLVVMGMGEPLANYHNLMRALSILNAPWGGHIGARKITISTSGLAPQIRQLAREPHQFRLAISLHAADDRLRSRLMPVNRKYPLRELVAACEDYLSHKGRLITFEYLLMAGVNDGLDHATALAKIARRLRARINLIPYNEVPSLPWKRPAEPVAEAFLHRLKSLGIRATLRREKGHDIDAACGQLRLKTEQASC